LASLNTARSKGQDAAIQSDLSAVATQAEIFYGNTSNTYGTANSGTACSGSGTLWAEATIAKAIGAAVTANGGTAALCSNTTTTYVIEAKMVAYSGYWCVDSSGTSDKRTTAISAGATTCPTT